MGEGRALRMWGLARLICTVVPGHRKFLDVVFGNLNLGLCWVL